MANKKIILDCGIEAENWIVKSKSKKNQDTEWLSILLTDLYNGGDVFKQMSMLFAELDNKGFRNTGLSLQYGPYESIDDVTLNVFRNLTT